MNQNNEKIVKRLGLADPDEYLEYVSVGVIIEKTTTGEEEEQYNELRRKTDYPITLSIPVPKNGSTKVKVFLNSELVTEFTEEF